MKIQSTVRGLPASVRYLFCATALCTSLAAMPANAAETPPAAPVDKPAADSSNTAPADQNQNATGGPAEIVVTAAEARGEPPEDADLDLGR